MRETALWWLSRGVVPVPLRRGSKRPAIAWRRLQEQPPPRALVSRWFSEERNLGLLCGKASNGLVVLDFDRALGYHRWRRAHPGPARTYTVRTGRGYHAYFWIAKVPGASLAMEGGEVKATGYVVAPPSFHPNGDAYRALDNTTPLLSFNALKDTGARVLRKKVQKQVDLPDREEYQGVGLVEGIKATMPITTYLHQYSPLRPSSPDGTWLMCRCPLHNDRRPSMWVSSTKGICGCFRPDCEGHGLPMDVINLHSKIKGVENERAIAELAVDLGLI